MLLTVVQLFDFDVESKPLVAVLVGKSIEQALVEVCEEEELISLRQRHVRIRGSSQGGGGEGTRGSLTDPFLLTFEQVAEILLL